MKATITEVNYSLTYTDGVSLKVVFDNGSAEVDVQTFGNYHVVPTRAAVMAAVTDDVLNYADFKTYTMTASDIYLDFALAEGLSGLPKAAIADSTAGAATGLATNYNLATGVLGLANALNTANAAQNDLGTKFNSMAAAHNTLLAELRAAGIIST